ncbi:MAG: DNA repair protein RecO [Patescibacteria group bacterium]|jgi:DNA repair protein RecO (recombination protein O)
MNETCNLKAIILKREPFRECDSKIIIYSLEKGKLALVARGAKKIGSKLSGHLEPFCYSEIMAIRGRQLEYAGSAVCAEAFPGIKKNLLKLAAAGRALKIFDRLLKENEPDEKIFFLLLDFLKMADRKNKINPDFLFHLFVLKLFGELGHQPELYFCVDCREKIGREGNIIDFEKGGLVCPGCQTKETGSGEAARRANYGREGRPLALTENCIKLLRLAGAKSLSELSFIKGSGRLEAEFIGRLRPLILLVNN